VLLVLAATNVWVHLGPSRVHVVTGPLAAGLLLLIGRLAGLTWQELGLGRQTLVRGAQVAVVASVAVAVVYAVSIAIPFTRGAFRDTRYRMGLRAALYTALVAIPLGTVVFEEVAFRGVLWGLLAREHGDLGATIVSASLFGLWHVLPAMDLAQTHTSVQGPSVQGPSGARSTPGRLRVAITVLATVVFTTLAGIVFAELRRRSGSLLAPIGLHWATNGLGVLAAARVWAISPRDVNAPDSGTADDKTHDDATLEGESDPSALSVSQRPPVWQRIVRRLWSSRS
jgi:membrane protease YdiL (CAAX protease family)